MAGNAKGNLILAGKGNETIKTAKGKDTVAINTLDSDSHVIITDYVSGTDKIRLESGVSIVAAETLKSGATFDGATLTADTMLLTLESGTGINKVTSKLAIEGAITTKKSKTTYGKITIIDGTKGGISYSQAYGVDSIAVANADGATVDVNGNNTVKTINAKKRTSKVVILGNENVNSIVGGTKNDTIYSGVAGATINGASGNDWIFGTEDSGTSISVTGGAGKDTIVASLGKNTLSGGKGNDVFVFEVVEAQGDQGGVDTILDFTTGTNKLYLESGTTLAASSISGNDTYLTLKGGSSDDFKAIKLNNTKNKKISIYDGTTGITTKQAYGVESISVADGDATTIDASLSYNSALKIINAKKVTKKALYLAGNSNDNSKIVGGSKADTIKSGSGNTTMTGGKGNDVFIYGGGNDTITDYSITSKNNDILQFDIAVGNPTYYHVEGKNVVLEFNSGTTGTNTLTIVNGKDKKFNYNGWTASSSSFGTLDSTFDGTYDDYTQLVLTKKKSQSDAKTGSTSLDYRTTYVNASKNSSAITIWGNDCDSTLIASTKADNIRGGSKNDLITTGKGKDTISLSKGNDTITDYTPGSDVLDLNGFTLKSARVNGNAVVFTTVKDSQEYELRVGGAVDKKGNPQKITIYDGKNTISQVYTANSITVANGDGDTINLSSSVNSGVKDVDASKRSATKSIYIIGNAQSNSLKGGKGNDTLVGGSGGNDNLIGGAGDDSLVGSGTGATNFKPGKGDDKIVISTESTRGKATITYTAGNDKIENYKYGDGIDLASSSIKATTASKRSDTSYLINFKGGGSLQIDLASGENANNIFQVKKDTTATKVSGSKSTKGGTGSDSGTTVYNWTVNYYMTVSGISGALYSTTTIEKVASKSEAVAAAAATIQVVPTTSSTYDERYDDYVDLYSTSELFADDVLASTDDLGEITSSTVDEAAIAVDLTTTTDLTDFKTDTKSLTTITKNDKE